MIANEEPAGKKYFPLAFSVFQFAKGVHPPRLSENPYFLRFVAIFSIKNARYISLEINI